MQVLNLLYMQVSDMIFQNFLGHQIEDMKELADYASTLRGMGSRLVSKYFELQTAWCLFMCLRCSAVRMQKWPL